MSKRDRVAREERSQKTIPQRLPWRDRACLTHMSTVHLQSSPVTSWGIILAWLPQGRLRGVPLKSGNLSTKHTVSLKSIRLSIKWGIILMTVFGRPSHRVSSKGSILFWVNSSRKNPQEPFIFTQSLLNGSQNYFESTNEHWTWIKYTYDPILHTRKLARARARAHTHTHTHNCLGWTLSPG